MDNSNAEECGESSGGNLLGGNTGGDPSQTTAVIFKITFISTVEKAAKIHHLRIFHTLTFL